MVASSGGGSGGAKSGGSGAAKVGDGAGESAHARPARQRLPDWVLVEWSRHVLRRNRAWPRAAGQLPLPALACRSQVVRVRGLLSDAEVEAVLALAATLPFARKHAASARTTCYLSTAGRFRTQLPVVRAKILDWLAAGQHGADIAAVRKAHRRHGGEGALYLVLKRRR